MAYNESTTAAFGVINEALDLAGDVHTRMAPCEHVTAWPTHINAPAEALSLHDKLDELADGYRCTCNHGIAECVLLSMTTRMRTLTRAAILYARYPKSDHYTAMNDAHEALTTECNRVFDGSQIRLLHTMGL